MADLSCHRLSVIIHRLWWKNRSPASGSKPFWSKWKKDGSGGLLWYPQGFVHFSVMYLLGLAFREPTNCSFFSWKSVKSLYTRQRPKNITHKLQIIFKLWHIATNMGIKIQKLCYMHTLYVKPDLKYQLSQNLVSRNILCSKFLNFLVLC